MFTAALWRSRPVFITSTSNDMKAEREHLRHAVFPALEARLKDRYQQLAPIDLQWTLKKAAPGESQANEVLVLKIGQAEIERSRPVIITLIGDRHDWAPTGGGPQPAAPQTNGAIPPGSENTALELDTSVFDAFDQRLRSHFYLREPLPYDAMEPYTAAQYCDSYDPEPGAAAAHARLTSLKERIKGDMPDRVRRYRAEWDAAARRVTGLEAWGRMVLEDLWRDLEEEINERPVGADPGHAGWQWDIANGREKHGDLLMAQGDPGGAMQEYHAALEIRARLAGENQDNLEWQRSLALGRERLGDILKVQGDLSGAVREYRAALEIDERLVASIPGNAGWQQDLSICREKFGDVLKAQGNLDGAMHEYRTVLALRERLAATNPGNLEWQRDLLICRNKLDQILTRQGESDPYARASKMEATRGDAVAPSAKTEEKTAGGDKKGGPLLSQNEVDALIQKLTGKDGG